MKVPFAAGVLFSCCFLAGPIMADGTDLTKTEITTTKINDHLYILEGGGSTVGALIGSDGVLLADGAPAPLAEKILAAVRKLSNAPIRFVINLNGDPDHTGANEQFAAQGATI